MMSKFWKKTDNPSRREGTNRMKLSDAVKRVKGLRIFSIPTIFI